MKQTGMALFIKTPRTIEDLQKPHDICQERPYKIVKTIVLGKMDYENFITDMLADRQFIEDNYALCSEGEELNCLLVKERGKAGGVLVVPENRCYVKYAAYIEK